MVPDAGGPSASSAVLRDMQSYLVRSSRFERVDCEPEPSPNSLKCYFDMGYYPPHLEAVYLDVTWFTNNDFSIHYQEVYTDGEKWNCRWDRHPNTHNSREHFHPGPDADRSDAVDESYPVDWRYVIEHVLIETEERMRGFW